MNSRSPEGCHKEARQASELYLAGPSKGLSLCTSGHSAAPVSLSKFPSPRQSGHCPFRRRRPLPGSHSSPAARLPQTPTGPPTCSARREAGIRLLSARRGRPPLLPTSPGSPRSRDRYSRLYGFHLLRARSAPIAPRAYSPKGRNSHTHP